VQEKRGQAVATLKKALGLKSVAAEAARLAGDLSYETEQYKQAAAFYQRVLNNHQSSSHFGPALLWLMWSHFSAGQHQAVVKTFKNYRKILPETQRGEAHYLAGSSWRQLDQPAQARAALKAAADSLSGASQAKALYKLTSVQLELDDYEAMQQSISRLRQQFPERALADEAVLLSARAARAQGETTKAASALSTLIKQGRSTPVLGQALRRRAALYREAGRLKAAVADCQKCLKAARADDATLRRAMVQLIDLHYRLKQYEAAINAADRLLAKSSLDASHEAEAMYRKGLAQVKLNQLEPALKTLNALAKRHPVNAFVTEARYYRGLLSMSLNQGQAAGPLLKKAADSDNLTQAQRANALRLLAIHQRETAKADAASKTLKKLYQRLGAEGMQPDELLRLARHALKANQPKAALKYARPLLKKAGQDKGQAQGEDQAQPANPARAAEAGLIADKAHRQLEQYVAASKRLRQVLALGGGFQTEARLTLGHMLADRGKYRKAVDEWDALFDANEPRLVAKALLAAGQAYHDLAQRQATRGRASEAKRTQKKARKLLM
jgi:outer membrane protein assembly factor BamD (BamD/ComL family)